MICLVGYAVILGGKGFGVCGVPSCGGFAGWLFCCMNSKLGFHAGLRFNLDSSSCLPSSSHLLVK